MLDLGESISIVINATYESVNELHGLLVTFILSKLFQLVSTLLDEPTKCRSDFVESRKLT